MTPQNGAMTEELSAREMVARIQNATNLNLLTPVQVDDGEVSRVFARRETPTEHTNERETLVAVSAVDDDGQIMVRQLTGQSQGWTIADETLCDSINEAAEEVEEIKHEMEV